MLFQGEKLTKIYNFYLIFILVLLSVMCLADSAFGLPSIGKSRSEAFILFHGTVPLGPSGQDIR